MAPIERPVVVLFRETLFALPGPPERERPRFGVAAREDGDWLRELRPHHHGVAEAVAQVVVEFEDALLAALFVGRGRIVPVIRAHLVDEHRRAFLDKKQLAMPEPR